MSAVTNSSISSQTISPCPFLSPLVIWTWIEVNKPWIIKRRQYTGSIWLHDIRHSRHRVFWDDWRKYFNIYTIKNQTNELTYKHTNTNKQVSSSKFPNFNLMAKKQQSIAFVHRHTCTHETKIYANEQSAIVKKMNEKKENN